METDVFYGEKRYLNCIYKMVCSLYIHGCRIWASPLLTLPTSQSIDRHELIAIHIRQIIPIKSQDEAHSGSPLRSSCEPCLGRRSTASTCRQAGAFRGPDAITEGALD